MIRAKYTSSGVLLIIPASGSGDFDAVLDGVIADVKGEVSTNEQPTGTHLHVDSLAMELNVKKTRMHIAKVFKNNRILSEYIWHLQNYYGTTAWKWNYLYYSRGNKPFFTWEWQWSIKSDAAAIAEEIVVRIRRNSEPIAQACSAWSILSGLG